MTQPVIRNHNQFQTSARPSAAAEVWSEFDAQRAQPNQVQPWSGSHPSTRADLGGHLADRQCLVGRPGDEAGHLAVEVCTLVGDPADQYRTSCEPS